MKSSGTLRALACWIGLAPVSPGAAADPELERLERDYLAQREATVRPLVTGFAERLRSLHSALVQRRDPRAAAVKAELDKTALRLSLPAGANGPATTGSRPSVGDATGRPAGGVVELRGPKAILTGQATYDEKIVAGVQFKGRGATAVWQLPVLKPGRYRVRAECGCAAGFGATAQAVFGDLPPHTFTVLPSSESLQLTSFNFGEVELPPGTTTFRVQMVGAPPRTKGSGGFTLTLVAITPAE